MNKFVNKLKNNKALGNGILGMIIAFFVIIMVASIVDIFISSIVQREIQNHMEMGQLYGLIKAVDVDLARREGKLRVNERIAIQEFKSHFNEMMEKYEPFIESWDTNQNSKDFIYVHKGKTSDYMYADGMERRYIAASSNISFYPTKYFRRTKPVTLNAVTRIFVDMDDTQEYDDKVVDDFKDGSAY